MLFKSFFTAGLVAVAMAAPAIDMASAKTDDLISWIKKLDGTVQTLDKALTAIKSDKITDAQRKSLRTPAATLLDQLNKATAAAKKTGKLTVAEAAPVTSSLLNGGGFIGHANDALKAAVKAAPFAKGKDRNELKVNIKQEADASRVFNKALQDILPPALKATGQNVYNTVVKHFKEAYHAYGGNENEIN